GGGVHGDEGVYGVAWGKDLIGREVQLEAADARDGSGRGPDFGGVGGGSSDVGSRERGGIGELAGGKFHGGAGGPRGGKGGAFNDFALRLGCWWNFRERRHFLA